MRQYTTMKMKQYLMITLLLLPLSVAVGGTRSTFYTTSERTVAEIHKDYRFAAIGSESMNTGSAYQSTAATGVFSVQGTGMHVNARRITGMLGSGIDNGESGDDDLFDDEEITGNLSGDPVSDDALTPVGEGLWVLLALIAAYALCITFRRRKVNTAK